MKREMNEQWRMQNDLKDDFGMLWSTIQLLHAMSDFIGADRTMDEDRRIILVQALSSNAGALEGIAYRLEERFKSLCHTVEEAADYVDALSCLAKEENTSIAIRKVASRYRTVLFGYNENDPQRDAEESAPHQCDARKS